MSDVLAWVDSTDAQGRITRRPVAPSGAVAATGAAATGAAWAYKRSPYQSGATGVESGEAAGELILEAGFRLTRLTDEGAASAAAVMRRRRADREAKGHYKLPSAGSVFKNDRSLGVPTGKLLDSLGLRGRRIGAAMVSPWHANIFVNEGGATAADMRKLIELAQREALERLGAKLECEVLMAGDF
jgi:UDP-N-acetylmuramate dehydrogenase